VRGLPPHWPVAQVSVLLAALRTHPVRGQNTPDVHACGMQNVATVLHLLLTHGADPGQSESRLHVHRPRSSPACLLHVCPDPHWSSVAQVGARAQFPPWGGVDDAPGPFWPTKIVSVQLFVNV
jgi:hypothetical protein